MTEIKVTFGALSAAQGDIAGTARRLDGQLADLKGYIAPLVASWDGQAAAEYQVRQRRWDTAAADLKLVLEQVGIAVGTAHDGYRAAELRNQQRWQV